MYWDRFNNTKTNTSRNSFDWYNNKAKDLQNSERLTHDWGDMSSKWRASNPSMWTPQFQQRTMSAMTNTNQAQLDNAQRQMDSKFGSSGLYGQPIHQSLYGSLGYSNATNLANSTSDLLNKIQLGRQEDYKDWYNAGMQKQQMERDWEMQKRQADFNQLYMLENQRMQSRQINDADNAEKRRFILSAITGGGGGSALSGGAVSSLPGLASMGAQGIGMMSGAQGAGGLGAQLRGLGAMGMTGLKTLGSGAVSAFGGLAGLI